jgi:cystathionine beta-lyase/cystathionine gamma-synthase
MFEFANEAEYNDIKYIRHNNLPNQTLVGKKIAGLEKADAGLVFSSGMSAITTTLLSILRAGDHLLAHRSLYGGSMDFVRNDLRDYGIGVTFVDACDADSWDDAVNENTKLIYLESITNPLTEVADFQNVVSFAKKHRLLTVIDSTFATPVNFRPINLGFDLVVHSCSKYMAGHSDLVAGAVAGRSDLIEAIRLRSNHFGGCLDPHACYILHRSLKTLPLRMERHNQNALEVARYLAAHPDVVRVYYPGLEGHPHHASAAANFSGFGGIVAFNMISGETAERVVKNTEIFIHAGSLGGVESLICRPSATSHLALDEEKQRTAGIDPTLIRLSVGIEDVADLIEDLETAISLA